MHPSKKTQLAIQYVYFEFLFFHVVVFLHLYVCVNFLVFRGLSQIIFPTVSVIMTLRGGGGGGGGLGV